MKEKILQLKKEKNAVILAHYYAPAEAKEVADYVGDSFYLAKVAKKEHGGHHCFLRRLLYGRECLIFDLALIFYSFTNFLIKG